jgi:transcriptional regulator of heat shock response
MMLSERQKDILQKAVFEYIDQAKPVSSSWLEERYDLAISPATVRSELLYLTEEGYLEQPYTSAGLIPTDQGYRFFVDELPYQQDFEETPVGGDLYEIGKKLGEASSSLIVIYLPQKSFIWKEGWEQVLRAPEFETREQIESFTNFLGDVERGIRDFHSKNLLEIYIGKENPFSKEEDFSIMISAYSFPKRQRGLMALLGPKRMAYQKNIGLLNSLRGIYA